MAQRLLARREHSCHELAQKLQQRHLEAEMIAQVLAECQQQGWLNDQRFAQEYTYHRSQRGYGALRIEQELAQRGVASSIRRQVLAAGDWDWSALACQLVARRFASVSQPDSKMRAKIQKFLLYRGFSRIDSRQALAELERPSRDD